MHLSTALIGGLIFCATLCNGTPDRASQTGDDSYASDPVFATGCTWNLRARVPDDGESLAPKNVQRRAVTPQLDYQSFDGTGNNKVHPNYGAEYQIYLRPHPANYADNNTTPTNGPNARLISTNGLGSAPYVYTSMSSSDLLPMWGLFLHTELSGPMDNESDPFPIPVPTGDTVFDPYKFGNLSIPFLRKRFGGVEVVQGKHGPQLARKIINEFTAFIDGTGLYSPTEQGCNELRGDNGLLKSVNYTVLGEAPPMENGFFKFPLGVINLVPHLTVTYILLLREHNRRARQIFAVHPDWTSDQVFHKARRWMIATMQRITMSYYYPTLVGEAPPAYTGYNPEVNPQLDLALMNVAMRYGHSSLNAVIQRFGSDGHPVHQGHLLLEDSFLGDNMAALLDVGLDPYLRGFAAQPEQEVDDRYVPSVRNKLPLGGTHPFDLVATNIQRNRELGLADYNTLRAHYNLSRATKWEDITADTALQSRMSALYGTSMDNIDGYVGGVMEDANRGKAILGPLSCAIVKENFIRIRDGDPYWYENPGVFTDAELAEIKSTVKLGNLVKWNTNITDYPDNPFVIGDLVSASAAKAVSKAAVSVMGVTTLSWAIEGERIEFVVESNAEGWFGFGFGENMLPADIYLFYQKTPGNWVGQDSYSSNTAIPSPDTSVGGTDDMINFTPVTATKYKHAFKFSRLLNTKDPRDVAITTTDMPVIFAYSDSRELQYHGPGNRAHALINFYSGLTTVQSDSHSLHLLNIFHGIMMFVGFAYAYPVGIYIARYWKEKSTWVAYHQTLMSLVSGEIILSAVLALLGGFGDRTRPHPNIGLVIAVLVFCITWLGRFSGNWSSPITIKYNRQIRLAHWVLGYATYFLGLVQGYLGVNDITEASSSNWLKWLYIPMVLMTPAGLLLWHLYQARFAPATLRSAAEKERESKGPTIQSSLPLFSWDAVQENVANGCKWLIIRGVVYDAEPFVPKHPGGAKLLYEAVGMDATDFFYPPPRGRRTDMNAKPQTGSHKPLHGMVHRHSRLAENLLASLAVGRIEKTTSPDRNDADEEGGGNDSAVFSTRLLRPVGIREAVQKERAPLSEDSYRNFRVTSRDAVTKGGKRQVHLVKIAFDNEDEEMIFCPGESVYFQCVGKDGSIITRPYTPWKSYYKGHISFYIKMNVGLMTAHLAECKSIRMRGPFMHAEATNPLDKNGCWDVMGLVAGGSGLTPMLLALDFHLRHGKRDPVTGRPELKAALLNVNRSDADMFAIDEIDNLVKHYMGNLDVVNFCHNVVNKEKYKGRSGQLTGGLLKDVLPPGDLFTAPSFSMVRSNAMSMHRRRSSHSQSQNFGISSASLPKLPKLGMAQTRIMGEDRGNPSSSGASDRQSSASLVKDRSKATPGGFSILNDPIPFVAPDEWMITSDKYIESPAAAKPLSSEEGPKGGKQMIIMVCGPPAMNSGVYDLLLSLKYSPEQIVVL